MDRGLLAEFTTSESLLEAARAMRDKGYVLDAWTPYPVPGLEAAIGERRSKIAWILGLIGFAGAGLGYLIQWFCNAVDYPLEVGGRPPHAAPAFIPITFETGVLLCSTAAFVSIFIVGKMPSLWRPIFEVEGFERATIDRFFLGVMAMPGLDAKDATAALEDLGALRVRWVGVP